MTDKPKPRRRLPEPFDFDLLGPREEGPSILFTARPGARPPKKKAPRPTASSPHWPTWNERWECMEKKLRELENRIDDLESDQQDAAQKISYLRMEHEL